MLESKARPGYKRNRCSIGYSSPILAPGDRHYARPIVEIMGPKKRKALRRRRPKDERLIIRDDPAEAPARRLKPTRTATLKAEFDAAHKDGMAALKRHDYSAVGEVIRRERKIVQALD